jgi:hypothetical protein
MTTRDAFWAANILMKFTREELAAIVETGEYSDPENARYFLEVLLARQLKCGRLGINAINPLDEFRIEDGALDFVNLSERYGFVEAESSYEIQWFAFDNETGGRLELSGRKTGQETRSILPAAPSRESFLLAEIRTRNPENPHWATPVGVYLRPDSGGYSIVGVERESPENNTFPMN